jgi:hypothetical protein
MRESTDSDTNVARVPRRSLSSDSDDAASIRARFDRHMSQPPSPKPTASLSRGRRTAIWALIVIASLLGVLVILATWVNRQMFDNSTWNKASAQLIQDPSVQSALSVYMVNSLYDNVDVPAAIAQRLPPVLKPLAVPAAAALRQPATDGVKLLLTRPRVQKLWVESMAVTHARLITVLENKTRAGIDTGNGKVTIDIGALLTSLGPQLGLPAAAVERIPPSTGEITVMRSNQLGLVQKAVKAVRAVSVWVFVLVLLMFAGALYLAAGERRTTLRNIGWAFVLVGLLVLVVGRFGGNYVVNSLTTTQYHTPAHRVWQIYTSQLRDLGWATILYGVVGVLGAVLAGPTRVATRARSHIAPVLNENQGIAWVAVGFVYLLLVLWGGTHALRTPLGILVLGGLLAVGVVAFRRQTLVEFPPSVAEPLPPPPPPAKVAAS